MKAKISIEVLIRKSILIMMTERHYQVAAIQRISNTRTRIFWSLGMDPPPEFLT